MPELDMKHIFLNLKTWTLVAWFAFNPDLVDSTVLDIFIDGFPIRSFPNASLGLEHVDEFTHQCKSSGILRDVPFRKRPNEMAYTPNRRLQSATITDASEDRLQLGVILALGGHNNGHYDYGPAGSLNGLVAVWDSWQEFFFSRTSNTTSLVLLLDERDFKNQNVTKSQNEYVDILLMKNMGAQPVTCAHLSPRQSRAHSHLNPNKVAGHRDRTKRAPPHGCSNKLALDQTYYVYYVDVAAAASHVASIHQKPLIIFAAVHTFPKPDWAKNEDEESLYVNWRPFRLNRRYPTNYGYVKMTNWYAYHMLNLQLLDFFDYASKLDSDVGFSAPFPDPNLPLRMARNGTIMLATQEKWYLDDTRITQGTRQCLESYMDEESKRCAKLGGKKDNEITWFKPGGENATILWEGNLNLTFRAHFLVYWLGLYAAPEVKLMAKYWNDWHPRGMWDFRWGDQQWWPRPIAVFGTGNIYRDIERWEEINTDNNRYVVHKPWPRYGTLKSTRYFNYSGSTRLVREAQYNESAKKQPKWRPF